MPTQGLPIGPADPDPDTYLIVTEVAGEAGIETGYCTDNPFLIGPRFANFRRTVDWIKPSFSQGAYRFLNKPFKRPATRSQIERYCCRSCPTASRSAACARWSAGTRSTATTSASTRPRVVRAGST